MGSARGPVSAVSRSENGCRGTPKDPRVSVLPSCAFAISTATDPAKNSTARRRENLGVTADMLYREACPAPSFSDSHWLLSPQIRRQGNAFLWRQPCRPQAIRLPPQKHRLLREHTPAMNQCGRISSCAKRNEYLSASCLIRSLKAVPIPCPELVLVRSKIGLLDLLASSSRATILRE